jgi:hypothetical protein
MLDCIRANEAEVELDLGWVPEVTMADSTKVKASFINSMACDLEVTELQTQSIGKLLMQSGLLSIIKLSNVATEVHVQMTSRLAGAFLWRQGASRDCSWVGRRNGLPQLSWSGCGSRLLSLRLGRWCLR